jgi:hypothetical protein
MKVPITKKRLGDAILALSFAAILAALVSVACGGSLDLSRKETSESIAKFALKAYGETQNAYSHQYYIDRYSYLDELEEYRGYYADWEMLVQSKFISDGVTQANIIKDYKLWTSVNNFSNYYELQEGSPFSTFTAVAFPRITRPPEYLATFAIREDHIMRIYMPVTQGVNAWGEDGDYGARTWEPIE